MALDAFTRLFGDTQGRIQPVNATPFNQDYMFVLGSDTAGQIFDLDIGDKVEFSQAADITGTKVVRFKAHFRGPSSMPGGHKWVLSWYVGAAVQSTRVLTPGREIGYVDGAFDVSQLTGVQTLMFRLELTS
jgi:hypothetical protein